MVWESTREQMTELLDTHNPPKRRVFNHCHLPFTRHLEQNGRDVELEFSDNSCRETNRRRAESVQDLCSSVEERYTVAEGLSWLLSARFIAGRRPIGKNEQRKEIGG